MKKYFVDCSYLSEHIELNTGIQRVVRRVIENLELLSKDNNFEVIPVNISNNQFKKIDIQNLYQKDKDQNVSFKVSLKEYLKNLYKAVRTLIVALFPFQSVKNFILAPRDVFGLNYLVDSLLIKPAKFLTNKKQINENVVFEEDLIIQKGDVLLLADSTWYLNIWPTVKKVREKDAKVVAVIYDLIPITHSQFCDDFLAEVFKKWFYDSLDYVDGFVTISDTVKKDLISFLNKDFGDKVQSKKFEHFLLGSDFSYNKVEKASIREELKEMYKLGSVYLIVSTIEPRKNHLYLLEVFEKLWAKGIDINLCIVGRIGWKVEEIMNKINTSKYLNKKLFHYSNLNDDELLYCYENSKMLLFPSIVEGFGLPIVESLTNKLPVLASDTPIHREVGQEIVGYFDLNNSDDLVNKLIDIEENSIPKQFIPDEDYKWLDWHESTKMLLDKIIKVS